MKKRINLFSKKAQSQAKLSQDQLQLIGTVAGIILFLMFMFVTVLQFRQRVLYNDLLSEKAALLAAINQNSSAIAKINYFQGKKNLLKTYLKNDSEFLPYYSQLKNLLTVTAETPVIESMSIDEKKQTRFVIKFTSFAAALDFIKYIESEAFLRNFSTLTLTNFTLNQADTQVSATQTGYKFYFEGIFKPVSQNGS